MLVINRKKEVYDQMLEAFEGLAFPLVVLGVHSDDARQQTGFVSVWLSAVESEMTPVEREELSKQLDRASRVLLPVFLRMVEKPVDPRKL